MRRRLGAWCVLWAALAAGCGGGVPEPEALAVGTETCASCRMTVSQSDFASQIVVSGELPKFFDDLGCLNQYLTGTPPGSGEAVIYVTDRRTREWVRAETAVFSRVEALSTPMGSHLVAHASSASREADPDAVGGVAATLADVVPAAWLAHGGK